jgi:hypothetical protein
MNTKDIIYYRFLYSLSKNYVPSQSKLKKYNKSKELKYIQINSYPKKLNNK